MQQKLKKMTIHLFWPNDKLEGNFKQSFLVFFTMNLAAIVKANECISLYKLFSSEILLAIIDTCKEKKDNLFINLFVLEH